MICDFCRRPLFAKNWYSGETDDISLDNWCEKCEEENLCKQAKELGEWVGNKFVYGVEE